MSGSSEARSSAGSSLWLVNRVRIGASDAVYVERREAAGGRVEATIPVADRVDDAKWIVGGRQGVWVASEHATLYRIDPARNAVVEEVRVHGTGGLRAAAVSGDALVVAADGGLVTIDPSTGGWRFQELPHARHLVGDEDGAWVASGAAVHLQRYGREPEQVAELGGRIAAFRGAAGRAVAVTRAPGGATSGVWLLSRTRAPRNLLAEDRWAPLRPLRPSGLVWLQLQVGQGSRPGRRLVAVDVHAASLADFGPHRLAPLAWAGQVVFGLVEGQGRVRLVRFTPGGGEPAELGVGRYSRSMAVA
ncbi:MAG TPA: hypothetical protein VKG45_15970 [Actinomycetes bacterium]|nr:hypothetical protein [Actinomycetes bacterium]